MTESERMAVAARLHVALRRKTGRVTDTDWMASNAEYAAEIIRFARQSAIERSEPELATVADLLEAAMAPVFAEAALRAAGTRTHTVAVSGIQSTVARYLGTMR